jgi:hypothetical protein
MIGWGGFSALNAVEDTGGICTCNMPLFYDDFEDNDVSAKRSGYRSTRGAGFQIKDTIARFGAILIYQ